MALFYSTLPLVVSMIEAWSYKWLIYSKKFIIERKMENE